MQNIFRGNKMNFREIFNDLFAYFNRKSLNSGD